jgi:hypothetical protein
MATDGSMMDKPTPEMEIEITPEMVLAGVRALVTFEVGADPSDWVVSEVYEAMRLASGYMHMTEQAERLTLAERDSEVLINWVIGEISRWENADELVSELAERIVDHVIQAADGQR